MSTHTKIWNRMVINCEKLCKKMFLELYLSNLLCTRKSQFPWTKWFLTGNLFMLLKKVRQSCLLRIPKRFLLHVFAEDHIESNVYASLEKGFQRVFHAWPWREFLVKLPGRPLVESGVKPEIKTAAGALSSIFRILNSYMDVHEGRCNDIGTRRGTFICLLTAIKFWWRIQLVNYFFCKLESILESVRRISATSSHEEAVVNLDGQIKITFPEEMSELIRNEILDYNHYDRDLKVSVK